MQRVGWLRLRPNGSAPGCGQILGRDRLLRAAMLSGPSTLEDVQRAGSAATLPLVLLHGADTLGLPRPGLDADEYLTRRVLERFNGRRRGRVRHERFRLDQAVRRGQRTAAAGVAPRQEGGLRTARRLTCPAGRWVGYPSRTPPTPDRPPTRGRRRESTSASRPFRNACGDALYETNSAKDASSPQ
jgi:hypothetical protein